MAIKERRGVWFDDEVSDSGERLTLCECPELDGFTVLLQRARASAVLTREQARSLVDYLRGVLGPTPWERIEGRAHRQGQPAELVSVNLSTGERVDAYLSPDVPREAVEGLTFTAMREVSATFDPLAAEMQCDPKVRAQKQQDVSRIIEAAIVVCRELVLDTEPRLYDAVHDLATALAVADIRVPHLPSLEKDRDSLSHQLDALASEAYSEADDPRGNAYRHAAAMVRGEQDENGNPL